MFLRYGPMHLVFCPGVAVRASNFCEAECLSSCMAMLPLQLLQHLAIVPLYSPSFRILECDLQNTNNQLGHKYIACVKNTYKESRSLKRGYLNSTQSKPAKRTWYQISGTAQQHIEQPERARGRDLLQLSTASFHFQNKYWML